MGTSMVAANVFACLVATSLLGRAIRRRLPQDHLSADSRDVIKLAAGLVVTMSALLLGLLVASARASYESARGGVVQMAADVMFLDRVLAHYGPDAADARALLRSAAADAVARMWPQDPGWRAHLVPDTGAGDAVYDAIHRLDPHDDAQRAIKAEALSAAIKLGKLRALMLAQMAPSVQTPMLVAVVSWLVVIFLAFSVLAPPNPTTTVAYLLSAVSVSGAILLILELDSPFDGMVKIPIDMMACTLRQLGN